MVPRCAEFIRRARSLHSPASLRCPLWAHAQHGLAGFEPDQLIKSCSVRGCSPHVGFPGGSSEILPGLAQPRLRQAKRPRELCERIPRSRLAWLIGACIMSNLEPRGLVNRQHRLNHTLTLRQLSKRHLTTEAMNVTHALCLDERICTHPTFIELHCAGLSSALSEAKAKESISTGSPPRARSHEFRQCTNALEPSMSIT